MLALLVSMASYVLFVFMAGAAAVRDASGNVADLVGGWPSAASCRNDSLSAPSCEYGLGNSYTVRATSCGQLRTAETSAGCSW